MAWHGDCAGLWPSDSECMYVRACLCYSKHFLVLTPEESLEERDRENEFCETRRAVSTAPLQCGFTFWSFSEGGCLLFETALCDTATIDEDGRGDETFANGEEVCFGDGGSGDGTEKPKEGLPPGVCGGRARAAELLCKLAGTLESTWGSSTSSYFWFFCSFTQSAV